MKTITYNQLSKKVTLLEKEVLKNDTRQKKIDAELKEVQQLMKQAKSQYES